MNYFEFFELPQTLHVDLDQLKEVFYKNSRKYHPDFFTLASEEQQLEALEKSTHNNEGYKVLQNFDQRLQYFLKSNNQLEEEGQNKIPQDFLMEMMDFNEQLMELEFDFNAEAHQKLLKEWEDIQSQLANSIDGLFNISADSMEDSDWTQLKDFYFKNQYLKRIKSNLAKFK